MFIRGKKPPKHKKGCKCFRCTGVSWNKGKKGIMPWNKGISWDDATKKKISNSLKGHTPWNKGKKLSKEHCGNLSKSHIGKKQSAETIEKRVKSYRGEKHYAWKGEFPSYHLLHSWLQRNFGKASRCDNKKCRYPKKLSDGKIHNAPSRHEWSNKSGEYRRDISDWQQLCPSCHKIYDKRFNNAIKNRYGKNSKIQHSGDC